MGIKNMNTGKTAKEMKELLLQEQTISASVIPEQPEPCQIPSPAPQIPEPLQSSQTLQQIYENQSYLAQLEIYKTQLAEITCQLEMKGKQYLKTIHDSWKEFRKTGRIQQYLTGSI